MQPPTLVPLRKGGQRMGGFKVKGFGKANGHAATIVGTETPDGNRFATSCATRISVKRDVQARAVAKTGALADIGQ
jgi:hypothetical protein